MAKRFQKKDFQQEGTDIYEAWLATCKRILRYNSDKKKEHALLELITQLAMEDFVNNETATKKKSGIVFQRHLRSINGENTLFLLNGS